MSFEHETSAPAATKKTSSASPERYVCVHGHFYQPPRENPWLETVEVQSSASPFHDWNERITAECYAPNGASRITNKEGQITRILNNYARMSFNFGPTLLSWLEVNAPRTYQAIQAADAASAKAFSGHGSALAQVYNHIIMPLASPRDARTQIRWGIADFVHRFGRRPEGMWLAETAVSRAVLDLLAQEGIKFTVLAPNQCARVRPLAERKASVGQGETSGELRSASSDTSDTGAATQAQPAMWTDTPDASVDPTRPYSVPLDEGRSLAVFFYDGPTSRAIAFEGLLNSGEDFGKRLLTSLKDDSSEEQAPQLAHVATDGESYGHHHRHGEMALSYAMHWIEDRGSAKLTNYAEFLAKFPPTWEAEVVENSSWSCFHGVERWRADCGCNGGKPGWNQAWRGPLREALDLLRDRTAPLAEELASPLLKDLWAARDAYISVVLDRSRHNVDRFFAEHATQVLTPAERVIVLELLEMERHTQLMYTSCGWFFDEISGIETVQIIAYAGRVLELAAKLFGPHGAALETEFVERLSLAKSNVAEYGDGARVYQKWVKDARIDLEHVGAHYAVASMFQPFADKSEIFCFEVQRHSYDVFTSGRGRVGLGRARLRSQITGRAEEICFAVLHLGDQNLSAVVKRWTEPDHAAWLSFRDGMKRAVQRAEIPEAVRLMDGFFGAKTYSLMSLFADEQQRILKSILTNTLTEVEDSLMRIYEEHATLLHFLGEAQVPAPSALAQTASFALNARLRRALEAEAYDGSEVSRLLRRAEADKVTLDAAALGYAGDRRMKRAMVQLQAAASKQSMAVLAETLGIAESLRQLPGQANLWQAQNIWNDLFRRQAGQWSRDWHEEYLRLGCALNIAVDELEIDAGVPTL